MSMKHILFKTKLHFRKVQDTQPPTTFSYDKKLGAWINTHDHSHLIVNKRFTSLATKKFDVETGEDQKRQ
jgi:hypothetical protein